jgi:predicted TIM-barrel fold metal-dependent hydrolase
MERPVKLIVRKDSQSTKNGDELSAGENATRPFRTTDLGRRTFLAGAAALGASLLLSREGAAAQAAAAAGPHRIDVHSHITPPSYSSDLGAKHLLSAPVLGWTLAKFIEEMDEGGVATSITSLAPPGVWTGDDAIARGIARSCNDYAARLVADHPGRFGMFGTLPIPDIEGTLHEIEYALDVLKADGVAMFTNSGDKWLGDPFYTPVFEELNRRKAVVFTHPRSATCCKNLLPGINDSNIEYGTDTTRAIVQIVANGVSTRFPDVRMIFPHAGGTMPFLSGRFVKLVQAPEFAQRLPQGFMAEAKKFYYDVAQSANPAAMAALLKVMPVSQIVFGTDYPFDNAAETAQGLKACGLFNSKDLRAIDRENALRLLPKYKT